ncbi:MAG TPA: M24 family metallopeptidase [Candidatus Dormibacteraeota bacterium]|nr:M24 family metallopeptidase [Candidatus Dormibacteraeota bacterium]
MNRAERLARLLRVLAAIIAEPGLNPLELAQRAGVSERTLRRDLAQLRDLGYDVAFTSGYEVQEKLNLDGRGQKKVQRTRGDDALLQAVAHAVETAGLWRDTEQQEPAPRPRKSRQSGPAPIVLIPIGDADPDFIHATGFAVESGLYVRFKDQDDVLVVSPLEADRARAQARVAKVVEDRDVYATGAWGALAARLLRERGFAEARVAAGLPAVHLEGLLAAGVDAKVDRTLFVAERRRKSERDAAAIEAAQKAAEAAVVEVVRELARAEIRDGVLWSDGGPLTSEKLYARAQFALGELGFTCPDMIVASAPDNALPHYRGEGTIRAHAPVIIDIFPTSRSTHFHGDLTRTVVVGEASEEVRRMHAATLQALDAGIETIAAGVRGKDPHLAVVQVLLDRGFGATTPKGFEGPDGAARMNHSTGHGVGLEVHEEPGLRAVNDEPLEEGDVVTVEPGLYLLGFGGVRIEDTGMVTKNGFQNFTTLTRSLDPRDYL